MHSTVKIQRSASSVSAEHKDVIYYLSIVFECCAVMPLAETIEEGLMSMLSLVLNNVAKNKEFRLLGRKKSYGADQRRKHSKI